MKDNARDKFWRKAIPALEKQVRFLSERKMEENLDHACGGDACEAFRMGAWEAQREMIGRLRELQAKLNAAGSTAGTQSPAVRAPSAPGSPQRQNGDA